MEIVNTQNLSFNYLDVFFSCYFTDEIKCSRMIKEHSLVYVYSGELLLEEKDKQIKVHSGECVFLRKDIRVTMTKQPKDEEKFKAVFMLFKRDFLRKFYQGLDKKSIPSGIEKHSDSVILLPKTPDIESLFQSMTPYFDTSVKPAKELMQLKMQEGVYSLLNIDKKFYPGIFDFTQPWKIDLMDFMDENYMYDLSLEEIANFTGRSLASFKRDFKKVSSLPPQKWLIEKRLHAAYDKIYDENKKISDVYLEVGFKNLSHFSSAFKRQFGHAPTK
jgi:AraC-like DNA-binding protein